MAILTYANKVLVKKFDLVFVFDEWLYIFRLTVVANIFNNFKVGDVGFEVIPLLFDLKLSIFGEIEPELILLLLDVGLPLFDLGQQNVLDLSFGQIADLYSVLASFAK